MQNVNVAVYRSVFMIVFMSLVPIAAATTIWSITALGWMNSVFVIIGALLYILGMFMVTGMGNVPLNASLKHIDVNHQDTEVAWKTYYTRWTKLNTLCCVFGILTGVSWIIAVYANI